MRRERSPRITGSDHRCRIICVEVSRWDQTVYGISVLFPWFRAARESYPGTLIVTKVGRDSKDIKCNPMRLPPVAAGPTRLLTNKPYRDRLLENVDDDQLRHFFTERFERWGRETPLMVESLLNKVTALTLNPHLASMLGASSCLDLQVIMDSGQILPVNLRTPDEETRNLLGSL